MRKSLIELILEQNQGKKARLGELTGNKSLDLKSVDPQDIDNETLAEEARKLEAEKLLKVTWYDWNSEIKKIQYRTEDLETFYRMAGQEPPWKLLERKLEKYGGEVQKLMSGLKKEWIYRYCEEELFAPLRDRKIPGNLEREHFLECLKGLDELTEPVYKRLFSAKYLSHSKEFERKLQNVMITAAKKYCPDVEEGMEASSVLSQLYIEDYSQQLWIKGDLRLELEGRKQDYSDFIYGAALNSQTLKHGVILPEQKLSKVITVENKANFETMKYEEGTLFIFTHGFLSPGEREFLRKLVETLPQDVEYYHTGDLDLGGIRIFHDIRTKVMPYLKPLQMDAETFRKYKNMGCGGRIEELKEMKKDKYCEELRRIEEPRLQELIEEILKEEWVIEQENFLYK